MNSCISCGMPLRTAADHAAGDSTRSWCRHCASSDGQMKKYEEVLEGMTAFLCRTQGIDDDAARAMARQTMATLPAWKDRP